jgi:hypothetical protein
MNMTERVSQSIKNFYNNSKEEFITKNENKLSFIDDRKDHVLERARRKYTNNDNIVTNIISRMIPIENPKVAKYYDKYIRYIILI